MDQFSNPLVSLTISLFPAMAALWWGHRLGQLADDAALPERILAIRRQQSFVMWASITLLFCTASHHVVWALPLLVLMQLAGSYPLRKRLLQETWSIGPYLWFFARLTGAMYGFWVVLAVTPSIVSSGGQLSEIIACIVAIVLVIWNRRHADVIRVMLGAVPVSDPGVRLRFHELRERCGLGDVRFDCVPVNGGVFANAFALPSLHHPGVVVSETLVARLDQNETAAILAHELAHLEHYNARRLRRSNLAMLSLIALGAGLTPALRVVSPDSLSMAIALWPAVLIASLAAIAQRRQAHETASDLRALALTGDSETLVHALIKVHAYALLPRRWAADFERRATHPSLARRIQAIRAAAGSVPAQLSETSIFHEPGGAGSVTFHPDTLVLNTGSTTHSIPYAQLREVRVVARSWGAPRLLAVDVSARRWEITLDQRDVATVQAILDIVDTHMAVAPPPVAWLSLSRTATLIVLLQALVMQQYAVLLVAWLPYASTSPSMTAGVGAAAIAAAGLIVRDHSTTNGFPAQLFAALIMFSCGAVLLFVSVVNRRLGMSRRDVQLTGLVAAVAALMWAMVAASGLEAISLHRAARELPGAAALTCAVAAALACFPSKRVRVSSIPVLTFAVLGAFLGTTTFLDSTSDDPFLRKGPFVTLRTIDTHAVDEFRIPHAIRHLSVSSGGEHIAVEESSKGSTSTIYAGRVGGRLIPFEADNVVFAGRGRMLAVAERRGVSTLRLIDLESAQPTPLWSLDFTVYAGRLTVNHSSGVWRLLGWNDDEGIVSVEGSVAGDRIKEKHWDPPADYEDVEAFSLAHNRVLALETRGSDSSSRSPFVQWLLSFRSDIAGVSRFWMLGEQGRSLLETSRLDLWCAANGFMNNRTLCSAFDGNRTNVFVFDSESHHEPIASMVGDVSLVADSDVDWYSGWWDQTPILFQASTRAAITIADPHDGVPTLLWTDGSQIVAAWSRQQESIVRTYSR